MFTIDLEKSLLSKKSNSIFTAEEKLILAEAEKILTDNKSEDIKTLSKLGLNYSLEKSERIQQRHLYVKGLDQSRIFSKAEIKQLCVSYSLRFLDLVQYKGTIDPKLPSKIVEFEKLYKESGHGDAVLRTGFNHNYDGGDYNYKIVAPEESFKLQDRPKDPLLFYHIGDGFYYLVHKWGEDISVMRWIKSLRWRNYKTWYESILLMYWIPLATILFHFTNMPWPFLILFLGASFMQLGIAAHSDMMDDGSTYLKSKISSRNWDNKFKT